jgi:hypothetical protein
MTQDEIIEMAIQGHASTRDAIRWAMNQECEACAKGCEEISPRTEDVPYGDIRWGWKYKCPYAKAIRTRKQA